MLAKPFMVPIFRTFQTDPNIIFIPCADDFPRALRVIRQFLSSAAKHPQALIDLRSDGDDGLMGIGGPAVGAVLAP